MVPDLTLEVIYLDQPTDFKMEFELCSSSNVRFLSLPVKSHTEFLSAISKSVVRSRVIITVGSFNPSDKLYIPKIIAKATGYELQEVQKETFGIVSNGPVLLPKSSLPLVDAKGNLGGAVLESNDQSIVMLTAEKELRHDIVTNLVCPYLQLFADKKTLSSVATLSEAEPAQNGSLNENVSDNTENAEPETKNSVLVNQVTEDNTSNTQPILQVQPETETNVEKSAELSAETEQPQETEMSQNPLPEYSVLEQPEAGPNSNFNLSGFLIDDGFTERKPKNFKSLIKVIISIVLVVAVILGTYFGYDRYFQPMQRNSVYEEVRKMYGQTWNNLPDDMLYKFGKLYQTNPDIYGWLSVPTTNINLPVVSLAKKTAGYYRSHLFDGSVNRYGTLYTTSSAVKGSYQRNIVIYGNDTGDSVMFSDLDKFLSVEYYKEVPAFTFDTLYLENKWKIFSSFRIDSKNRSNYLKTTFFDDAEFLEYIQLLEKVSVIDTNIDVKANDQIVTLVSQSDGKDVMLVARRVRDNESPMVDITGATENYTAQNSSDIPAIVKPLEPIETSSESADETENEEPDMTDGASSRFEQKEPLASTIIVKPKPPIVTSVPNISTENTSSNQGSHLSSSPSDGASNTDTNNSSNNGDASNNMSNGEASNDGGSSNGDNSVEQNTSTNIDETNSSGNESGEAPNIPVIPSEKLPILTATNTFNGAKVKGNAIDIIAQNIEAEMGASFHIEALKAQAVAAYSWLLNNGSANGKYPELPLKTPSQKCITAAEAVAGQVAVYNGSVATTVYHAISAGRTAFSQDIWSSATPYLVSVDSSVDKNAKDYQTQRKYSAEKIAEIAEELLDINLRKITDKNKWFSCTYDANGVYCTKISIGGVEQKGTYMRNTFFSASRVGAQNVLRSSAYTISYNKAEDAFIFTVKGYGHGVGMSQVGANAYAKNGWNYEEILKHYYTGVTIGTYY